MFNDVDVMPEQEALLATLVEAARNVPSDQRENFLHIESSGPDLLFHDGLSVARQTEVITQDLDILVRADLLDMSYNSAANREYWVTPKGYRFYEHVKTRDAEPIEQVEREIRGLIESEDFAERYPDAHEKWLVAARVLWRADSERDATIIGHLCREAVQAFASHLIEVLAVDGADADTSHDVARIRAVLQWAKARIGDTEHQLLDALLSYWGAVSDLAQRQVHGASREAEPLGWEDSRRLVFQTAVVLRVRPESAPSQAVMRDA